MIKSINGLITIFIIGIGLCACNPLDGSEDIGSKCINISESNGKELAKEALWNFIVSVKEGNYGAVIATDDVKVVSARVDEIQYKDLIYLRRGYGEVENGSEYEFHINSIDELVFSVAVFNNCNTEVRLMTHNK